MITRKNKVTIFLLVAAIIVLSAGSALAKPKASPASASTIVANFDTLITYLTVACINNSTGKINSYYWDFGDGTSSSQQAPTHTYNVAGSYKITLTVSQNHWLKDSVPQNVTVSDPPPSPAPSAPPPPIASFTATSTTGKAPLTVNFTDKSSNATGWLWNFGDNATSTAENPVHIYANAGTFIPLLTVNGPGGVDSTNGPTIDVVESTLAPPSPPPSTSSPIRFGWYSDVTNVSALTTYASHGARFMLGAAAGWYWPNQSSIIKKYLDTAQSLGVKVILDIYQNVIEAHVSDSSFISLINTFKDHPALAGWYIADEPDLTSNPSATHTNVKHYYDLLKQYDNHPCLIAYCCGGSGAAPFQDVTDMEGFDFYPAHTGDSTFGGQIPESYDRWAKLLQFTATYNKTYHAAIPQGCNVNGYRDMSDAEFRYHIFSGIVQGVDTLLFWYDGWATSSMVNHVNQMMDQISAVSTELGSAGKSFDPQVAVNQSATNLAYRYGVNGSSHVLLAVNIANRTSGGKALTAQFTLPADVGSVDVLNENRKITVSNGVFTDEFAPFEVHIYRFIK
jgi:PKD repeat protein